MKFVAMVRVELEANDMSSAVGALYPLNNMTSYSGSYSTIQGLKSIKVVKCEFIEEEKKETQ